GECVITRIQEITTRFGEPVDYSNEAAGTAISFENGSFQISYRREEFYGIEPGHRTVICLMTIPRDCPDGDERGREFYTLDLDINRQWIVSDSQHSCGGA
ncbi:MAG: hypothetical protein KDA87_26830, partial [Planctomycetales bacterium]|nr:hypothetical protein [Planctomycetales bacterium]